MFSKVEEAINWIENIKRNNKEDTLIRMNLALDYLGHPEKNYKKIHVTGTNGKGSTVSFISNVLIDNGYKVGMYVSPYVSCFNERIQINNEYISDKDLLRYTNVLYDLSLLIKDKHNQILSFFEVITIIGFLYFNDNNIDVLVIEVGMGGKLDATNIIDASLSIITNVSLEHTNALGKDEKEITINKLGIVKNGGHLITGLDNDLLEVANTYCKNINASIFSINFDDIKYELQIDKTTFYYKEKKYVLSMLGYHQVKNAIIAIEAINYLFPNITNIENGLYSTKWIGRLERVYDKPLIFIDGAHNKDGINSLAFSIKNIFEDYKINLLFSALKDKDTKEMINIIEKEVHKITITSFDDIRIKNPLLILNEVSIINKRIIEDYKKAIDTLILECNSDNDLILVCGSLHFISFVRKYILSLSN